MLSDPTWQPHNELCDERSDNASGQVIRQKLVEEDPEALVFEDFLKFLYTATVTLTTDNVLSLVRLADKYMIPELHGFCNEFIDISSSDSVTMLSLLPKARAFNVPNVINLCHQSLLTNFNFLSGQQLLDMDAATLLLVLDSGPDLVVESEYALFEKIEPWLNQCEDDNIFVEVIKCIRFPFMNAAQLLKVTTTAVFLRASEKLPDLPLEVWQLQTLFREGSHGELPDEFPDPRLYLRPPNSDGSKDQIRQDARFESVAITVGSQRRLHVSPWIKKAGGEKQIFQKGKDKVLRVTVKKVSQDQIEIKLRSKLPFVSQKYHAAIAIGQPKQTPKYLKASGSESRRRMSSVNRRSKQNRSPYTAILNCKAKFAQPIRQGEKLRIHDVALIFKKQKRDSGKKVT
ncbi:BTB/POZ domain-containing protein 17-like [Diadema setosum]|uniref:BTB/POZ domain-containing protein 17-like n=1 Tax=Diadema setosum TaxID=31175 RepID=UPI003B3A25ED